jgi:hypothetical protein
VVLHKIPHKPTLLCFYTFDSVATFLAAFTPHAEELQGDMKHYTDIDPQIQFNEIRIEKASH